MRTSSKVLVSVGLLYWIIERVLHADPSVQLAAAGWGPVILVWLLQSALPVVQAERWRIVAAAVGARCPFFAAVANVYLGQFFNQLLPSSVGGDAARIWRLRLFMPLRVALASVAIDRIIALLAVPIIVLVGSGILTRLDPPEPFRWTVLAMIAAIGCGLALLLCGDRIRLPAAVSGWRAVDLLRSLSGAARRFFSKPGRLARALSLSIVIHAGVGTSLWILALAYSVNAPVAAFLVLAPLITMATTVPISIGGWGVREGATVALLSLVDVPPAVALAISVQFGLIMMVVGLPGGVVMLLSPNRAAGAEARPDRGRIRGNRRNDVAGAAGSAGPSLDAASSPVESRNQGALGGCATR